jgi:hypothetical protein
MVYRHRQVVCRLVTAVVMLIALAGCEHGDLSFDRSSGTFRLPIGEGSHESP